MKKILFIVILLCLSVISVKVLYSKNSVTGNEGTLKYKHENIVSIGHTENFGKLEYGKVLFKHQLHVEAMAKILNRAQEKTCNECHFKDQYGEYSFDFTRANKEKNPEQLKNAYHSKCLSCHQKLSSQGKRTGPEILSCRDCHKKEYEKKEVKYSPFEFDFSIHEKHVKKNERDCSLCHHTYDIKEKNKELALVYEKGKEQSCYYCHDLNKKRGPELTKILKVAKEKNLSMEKSCHLLCLNCHLQNKSQEKDSGPIICSECHTGKYKTLSELRDVPRPEVDQPKTAFIKIEEAKMKGVPFKHDFHELNNKTCRVCHHETLKACKECHNLKGKEEGGYVNIATAYHSLNSELSCQGCHKNSITNKECYGCHYFIPPVKIELGNKETCNKCHSGKRDVKVLISTKTKKIQKIQEEVLIKHLEQDFEPVKMPHYKMIRKLNEISNQSNLAKHFHGNENTICRGCHHKSIENAEVEKEKPPLCISCHSAEFGVKDIGRPRLQSAYHGMCIRCHENMNLEKPKKCTDCHERKVKQNVHN